MSKTEKTIEVLQNILLDLDGDDELMNMYGEALKFAIKCVKYTERNRWHDYNKEKPKLEEKAIYDILEIMTYNGVGKYVEGEDFYGFDPGGDIYGEEEHVYWKPYLNDRLEEDDINTV